MSSTHGKKQNQGKVRGSQYHHRQSTQPPPCREFQKSRTCRFGTKCRFSHDLGQDHKQDAATTRREKVEITESQVQAIEKYNGWKRLIKIGPNNSQSSFSHLLWADAVDILNSDDQEGRQKLPKDLDSDEYYGKQHINALMSTTIQNCDAAFILRVKDFLLVFTHPSLIQSLSVDTFVGTLYNFITGPNGARAIPFLGRICEALKNNKSLIGESEYSAVLVAMITMLREILRREGRARLHDDLPVLIDHINEMALEERANSTQSPQSRDIEWIRAMSTKAREALVNDANYNGEPAKEQTTSAYPRPIEVPGGRHDNDHEDITDIRIFPTLSELRSDRTDYLPSLDQGDSTPLTDRAARHIDAQFRLLRHDTFNELKVALGRIFYAVERNPDKINDRRLLGDLRAHRYRNAFISRAEFDKQHHGAVFQISVSPSDIPPLQKLPVTERQKWWNESRRLSEGILLSLIVLDGSHIHHLFLVVVDVFKSGSHSNQKSAQYSEDRVIVTTKLLNDKSQEDLELALKFSFAKSRGLLLEFPGIIPATFTPVLEHLKWMQRNSYFPFPKWILPAKLEHGRSTGVLDVPPPMYARKPGFVFSLQSIMRTGAESPLRIDPMAELNDELLANIKEQTTLDLGQCEALLFALKREFAFIQGPPGTGKSYLGLELMKVLLDHKEQANLGPIIVVCYTNHALDQFLEHLVKTGIKKVIRIGGQSRSTLLEKHNLREVRQTEKKTKGDGHHLAELYRKLEYTRQLVDRDLAKAHGLLRGQPDWRNFGPYLMRWEPQLCQQFGQVDKDGFQSADKRHPFDTWARGGRESLVGTVLPVETLLQRARVNINSLTKPERVKLLQHWTEGLQSEVSNNLYENMRRGSSTLSQKNCMHDEYSKRALSKADVIGVTTTGLAKNIALFGRANAKVVICEEAGEVMEPHILSALLPRVEHVIQIGDHQQLRPQINTFKLSLECPEGLPYQLDRSQFERLVVGAPGLYRMPVVQLNVQRRMRPEISNLIRETLYPKLIDHPDTPNTADVVGLRSNVLWLDHRNKEERQESELHHKSHSNDWEVSMVQALVRHLIRQGEYSSEDIAVLAPYTGQVSKLRRALGSDFEIVLNERDEEALEKDGLAHANASNIGPSIAKKSLSALLRLATIDNFQGEEAKFVIVSLVRSNEENKVGFLKTTNRINVLLSRAQHGMYIIGNSETYSGIPMWEQIINILRAQDKVKKSIGICCPRHKETPIEVSEPEDFERFSPEGGCQKRCLERRDCGHPCQAYCHTQLMHGVFLCPEPCQRLYPICKHPCQKATCGEDCGKCQIKVKDVELPCGHRQDVRCYQLQNLGEVKCSTTVGKIIEGCNHSMQAPCFKKDKVIPPSECTKSCEETLPCGHICPGICRDCRKDTNGAISWEHKPCQELCKRYLNDCSHICVKKCHQEKPCGVCTKPCEVRCQHSKCTKSCGEACAPCVEPCTWSCDHQGSCTMPCGGPCTRLPCDKRCSKTLPCGHQCPGVCGEQCPEEYCQECGLKSDSRVDLLEMKTYSEINVNDNPIIVLGCGHFFTIETLDGMIGMDQVYSTDQSGKFAGLSNISGELASHIPRCPDCKCQMKQYVVQRYGRLVNRAIVDHMMRRFLTQGMEVLDKLTKEISLLEADLAKSSDAWKHRMKCFTEPSTGKPVKAMTREPKEKVINNRYNKGQTLCKRLQTFIRQKGDSKQPAYKINQAMVLASRKTAQTTSITEHLASLQIQDSDVPITPVLTLVLGGQLASSKLDCIVLEDKLSAADAFGSALPKLITSFFDTCTDLIHCCFSQNQPRLAVEATLVMARLTGAYSAARSQHIDLTSILQHEATAKKHLQAAQDHCTQMRQQNNTFAHQGALESQLGKWTTLLSHKNNISPVELTAIKSAMLSGPSGLATHAGHWYRCANGHLFAIGECGMPMELARCPECGCQIGGLQHRPVEGVERAEDMER